MVTLRVETVRFFCAASVRSWMWRTWRKRAADSNQSDCCWRRRCSQRAVPSVRWVSSGLRPCNARYRRPAGRRWFVVGRRSSRLVAVAVRRRRKTTSRDAASPATSWHGTRGERSPTPWKPGPDALARVTEPLPLMNRLVECYPSMFRTPAC